MNSYTVSLLRIFIYTVYSIQCTPHSVHCIVYTTYSLYNIKRYIEYYYYLMYATTKYSRGTSNFHFELVFFSNSTPEMASEFISWNRHAPTVSVGGRGLARRSGVRLNNRRPPFLRPQFLEYL